MVIHAANSSSRLTHLGIDGTDELGVLARAPKGPADRGGWATADRVVGDGTTRTWRAGAALEGSICWHLLAR
jgi:hypothetical protein